MLTGKIKLCQAQTSSVLIFFFFNMGNIFFLIFPFLWRLHFIIFKLFVFSMIVYTQFLFISSVPKQIFKLTVPVQSGPRFCCLKHPLLCRPSLKGPSLPSSPEDRKGQSCHVVSSFLASQWYLPATISWPRNVGPCPP